MSARPRDRMNVVAERGFGMAAGHYARGRPSYPDAAVAWLTGQLGIRPGSRVVDLGAGTGTLSRLIATSGAAVTAVEPVAAMRAELAALDATADVVDATAEDLPLPARSVDAVVAGQAFHWFDAPAALDEAARVLVPGGGLGLLWNVRDETVAWIAEVTALLDEHDDGAVTRYRDFDAAAAITASEPFGPVSRRAFQHTHSATLAAQMDRFLSISFVAALPAPGHDRFSAALRRILEANAVEDGTVVVAYRTDAFVAHRR